MCRYGSGRHIIGRMLDRGKGIDFLPMGKHDNASRVLSRRSSHTDAASHNPVYLTAAFANAPVLVIALHIAVSRLIGQCADCSGTEGLPFSENNFRIGMRAALVLSREIQVDIRLLVTLKAEEGFKWNIVATSEEPTDPLEPTR